MLIIRLGFAPTYHNGGWQICRALSIASVLSGLDLYSSFWPFIVLQVAVDRITERTAFDVFFVSD